MFTIFMPHAYSFVIQNDRTAAVAHQQTKNTVNEQKSLLKRVLRSINFENIHQSRQEAYMNNFI